MAHINYVSRRDRDFFTEYPCQEEYNEPEEPLPWFKDLKDVLEQVNLEGNQELNS